MRIGSSFTFLFTALFAIGCGGFQLRPVTPERAPDSVLTNMAVAGVNVGMAGDMEADQRDVMVKLGVAPEMQRVLVATFQQAGGGTGGAVAVNVTVTSIRYSGFGPTRMHTRTEVVGPDGTVIKSFENDSTSIRSKALERVAQDMVGKIANGV